MSLTREATTILPGFQIGDVKPANYDITFTANQLVEPASDSGWFLLNGAVISQAIYPVLFARYGSTFNTGSEGAGNFRLPNHTEGKFPIAKGLTSFTTYGASGGEATHVLLTAEMPVHLHADTLNTTANSHDHSGSITAVNGGGHTHQFTVGTVTARTPTGGSSQIAGTGTTTSGSGGISHAHTVGAPSIGSTTETYNKSGNVVSAGSDGAHNNMMPYVVIGGLLVKYG